jgi:hypothetical protein
VEQIRSLHANGGGETYLTMKVPSIHINHVVMQNTRPTGLWSDVDVIAQQSTMPGIDTANVEKINTTNATSAAFPSTSCVQERTRRMSVSVCVCGGGGGGRD